MPLIACRISDGLRPQEVTASFVDFEGRPQFLPVQRDFVHFIAGRSWLPVFLVCRHEASGAALVALPVEADSGDHRVWVAMDDEVYRADATEGVE